MNTNDLLTNWSTLSFQEIGTRLEAGTDDEAVNRLFGASELAEMRAMAQEPEAHGLREAVVLLPGIMGSLLTSVRGTTGLLWINPLLFLQGRSAYLELNQDGSRDACPEIEAVPAGLEKVTYTKIGVALRRQTDLYEFPYDWRRPISWNADLLHDSIEHWADGDHGKQFSLVGHSMGGLVSRAYLARHARVADRRIKHLIMHGTPHYGAAGAIENILMGNRMMSIAAKLNEKNAPQRLLLNLPSVYELLPAPPSFFPSHRPYPASWDLYDASSWQLEGMRQDYLQSAQSFHKLLARADTQVQVTQIAGCNCETIVDVQRTSRSGEAPKYEIIYQEEGPDAGDGTVPLWSAVLPTATMYYIQEVHRDLPKNKKVIDATLALIHGGRAVLPTSIPERKAGLLHFEPAAPVEVEAERLRERLDTGNATAGDLAQLHFAF